MRSPKRRRAQRCVRQLELFNVDRFGGRIEKTSKALRQRKQDCFAEKVRAKRIERLALELGRVEIGDRFLDAFQDLIERERIKRGFGEWIAAAVIAHRAAKRRAARIEWALTFFRRCASRAVAIELAEADLAFLKAERERAR